MQNRPWQRHYDFQVPETFKYPQIPASEFLMQASKLFPDKPALDFYGSKTTFWTLRKKVLAMARIMGEMGVKKGDRVAVHLPNSPQYVIAFYATLSLGAVVVNLNPMYTADELSAICENTGVSTLFTFDMVLPNIRSLTQRVRIPRVIVTRVTDFIEGFPVSTARELELEEGWRHFSELLDNAANAGPPRVDIKPQDPALIQFTGGTTGIPKGAVLTHRNLVAGTIQAANWGAAFLSRIPTERQTNLAVLPFFHVYGTIVVLNTSIYNCATQVLVPRFEVDELMGIISGFDEINFFPAVPTMINAVINHPRAEELELDRRIGLFNSGGGPLATELIDRVCDMGINYSEGWGMSETTSLGISNPVMGLKKTGSIGVPFPDADIRLVDLVDGKQDVPRGEPGEILFKSPLVMAEYWNNPEETRNQLTEDGWLYTGDIAVMDEDDYIYIVDRKKDMIIAGGYNIYPREVDEVLYQHPKVADAVTIGVADEYRGETVKAFIVLKPGEQATDKDIMEFARTKLAAYKAPRIVEFREELPKSAVGKILRKELRKEEESKQG
ncbi:MAG: long-chain-fatty-acid--CoA ligase [Desulfobacterales bacterium]